MNVLFCSAGRRVKLINNFRNTLGNDCKLIVAENSIYSPARYVADKSYTVPLISDANYIDMLLDICKKEKIDLLLTLIDPEIELLSKNKRRFEELGVLVITPDEKTSKLCFDKYKMFNYLRENGINTVMTYDNINEFSEDYNNKKIDFPVFVKPRTGSGSVGARKVNSFEELKEACEADRQLIIQEFMDCEDLDADVYVDTISHKVVSIFSKRKLATTIGGASKTISFKDEKLYEFIKNVVPLFEFNGIIDMDFFYKNGEYYLSEVNPRFGGAYLHAYGAGVDFIKLIKNNVEGIINEENIGDYEENIVMMMYDDVIIEKIVNN